MTFTKREFRSRCNGTSAFDKSNFILQHVYDEAVLCEIESESLSKEYLESFDLSVKEFAPLPLKRRK